MDLKRLLEGRGLDSFPAGLGGCRAAGTHFESCGYDVFVFDERSGHETVRYGDSYAVIRHASLSGNDPKVLLGYDGMHIIQDESWDLRMLVSRVQAKKPALFTNLARNNLIEALFCIQRTMKGIQASDAFAPFWQKCASYCLADAICLLNHRKPSPSHMLETLRLLPKNPINEHISSVTQTIGMERATTTLLERMLKSTIGFSDMVRAGVSGTIRSKYDFFLGNSMPTDCYFYLGYVNRQNFERIKGTLDERRDLFHVLRTAFDTGADSGLLEEQAGLIKTSCNSILETVSGV